MTPGHRAFASEEVEVQTPHALTKLLALARPLVMGILNITPDSFSDGGHFVDPATAISHAEDMIMAGADILDVGGESTRPYGAVPISAEEEWARVGPVLSRIVTLGVPISIDTMKATVADRALAAGAAVVNDVWGLQRDPEMARVAAKRNAGLIIVHNRTAVDPAIDIINDIHAFFARSLALADDAGMPRERIVLDPGIGFGKTPEQSIQAIARLTSLKDFGLPLLIGLSRKRFIASIGASEPNQRLGGSIAGNLMAAQAGAAILRVHDVAETVQALRLATAIEEAR